MKKYTIYENMHYSHLFPHFHFSKSKLDFDFMFGKNCLYSFPDIDNQDVNKLFGTGFGFSHHKDSWRLGWNCSEGNNNIQLYSYYYNQGIRKIDYICDIAPNVRANCFANFDRTDGKIYVHISFSGNTAFKEYEFDFKGVPKFGFTLYPFFGGNKVSPVTMNIYS